MLAAYVMPAGWPRMLSQGFCGAEDGQDTGDTGFTQTPAESEPCLPTASLPGASAPFPSAPQNRDAPPLHDTSGAASELQEGTSSSHGMPGTYMAFHVIHAERDTLVRVVPLMVLAALAPPAQPVLYHLRKPDFSTVGAHGWLFPVFHMSVLVLQDNLDLLAAVGWQRHSPRRRSRTAPVL